MCQIKCFITDLSKIHNLATIPAIVAEPIGSLLMDNAAQDVSKSVYQADWSWEGC